MSDWFIKHRQDFIRATLKAFGQIRRSDIQTKFGVSMPQASADIGLFMKEYPDAIIFDGRAKTYVLNPDFDDQSPPQSDPPTIA